MGITNKQLNGTHARCIQALLLIVCLSISLYAFSQPQQPMFKILHVEHLDASSRVVPQSNRFRDPNQVLIPFDTDLTDAYWLKPFLANQQEIAPGHLFALRPTTLHRVDMYIPALDKNQPIHSLGRFDVNTSPKFSHRAMVFELPDNYRSGQDVFFYIQSRSDEQFYLEYWEHDDYLIMDRKKSGMQSAMFAGLFVLLFLNIIFFLATRNLNHVFYIAYLASVCLFAIMGTGKIYEFGLAKIIAGSYNSVLFIFVLTCLTLTVFIQQFLQLKKYTPVFYELTKIYVVFYSVLLFIALSVWPVPYILFSFVNYTALLPLFFLLYSAFTIARDHQNKQANYFLLAFLPLISVIALRILAILDYVPDWDFLLEAFEPALIFQALVLSIGLVDQLLESRKLRDADQILGAATLTRQGEKDFSDFIARIGEEVRAQPNKDHDEFIVTSFFERLKHLYKIDKIAILYQVDAQLNVLSDTAGNHAAFNDYVSKSIGAISRACHSVKAKELTVQNHPSFSQFSKMLLIPVHMREHEWSGMLLNVQLKREFELEQFSALQRYATEMVRIMINAHNLNHFSIKAKTDDLTQVMNRGAILDVLEAEIDQFQVSRSPLSIAFVDIDHLKNVNDSLGHEAGDICLSYLALQSKRHLPENASIGRLGGDEFLFVFPNHVCAQAKAVLTAVSNSLETLIFDEQACSFTLSVGIAQYAYRMDVKEFLRYADESLYKAKKNGRAQIIIAA